MELKLTNSSGTKTTALVLCDIACSNSWLSNSLADGLGLQGTALKLSVKGINTEEIIDTKVVQLTVTPHEDQDFEAFTVRHYVRETLNVGSDIIDVESMQETCPPLAVLDPVLRGPLPSSSSLASTRSKPMSNRIMNQLVRLSHGMIWNRTARTNRLTQDLQWMLAREKYLKQQLFITAKDTMLVCYGLMTTSSSRITTFRHRYSSNLSKKGFLTPDAHMVEQRSGK